jgi:ribose transport system permease protein
MDKTVRSILLFGLRHAPLVLLALVLLTFGALRPRFLHPQSLVNIAADAAAVGIVATGMTVVLLTGGIDLSVGAAMYVAAGAAGLLLTRGGQPLWVVLPAMLGIGLAFGAVNGLLVARLSLLPFVVTLATWYAGRGLALWMTETRAMRVSDAFAFASTRVAGLPFAAVALALVVATVHAALSHTPFGLQLYAVGHDAEAARKAGVPVRRRLLACYVISGGCAALAAVVSLGQLGAVSQKFGLGVEFEAIAAAVLGGTSLFGGRGRVFPGTLVGALLLRTLFGGLVMVAANEYTYPLVTAAVVFLAVLIDVARNAALKRVGKWQAGQGSAT